MERFAILFVDDDREILSVVQQYLAGKGYEVQTADSGEKALERIAVRRFDMVFTDYKMPGIDGIELLSAIKERSPDTVVVIVTGHGTMDSAIQAMRFGSYDFLQKPFKLEVLRLLIDRVVEEKALRDASVHLQRTVPSRHRYGDLVGANLRMQQVYETIDRMKDSSPPVFLRGESGTGKQLAARVIHGGSDRRFRSFTPVDCAGLRKRLTEERLRGQLEELLRMSNKGAVYLEEFFELPAGVRQWLAERMPAGQKPAAGSPDVRILAASSHSVEAEASGGVAERMQPVTIEMPALRDRKEDIPLLLLHFLHRLGRDADPPIAVVSPEALDVMMAYDWPGNIIQLESVLQRAQALGVDRVIQMEDLPVEVRTFGRISPAH